MLDFDLAELYGVETRALNQAVKRNAIRFEGNDFMFRLTKGEAEYVRSRSQIVTLNENYEDTRAQLDVISIALAELQSKETEKKERKPIGFIQRKDDK